MGIKGTLIKCALVKARELELIVNQATVANARAIECFLVTLHSSGGGWGRPWRAGWSPVQFMIKPQCVHVGTEAAALK